MRLVNLFLWTMSMFHLVYLRSERKRDHLRIDSTPKFVLLAPKVFKVGNEENVLLEAIGLSEPVTVSITAHNYPTRNTLLWQGTITLNFDNNYSALKTLKINPSLLQPEKEHINYLQFVASFGQLQELKFISKVSFHAGYIFIQTDKPVYNPGDRVRCRVFVSTPEFQAHNGTISVDIQNPDGIAVYASPRVRAVDGIYSDIYTLSDIVKEGKWKIVAKFDSWKENTFSADFEVKKYVLPAFNATLIPKKAHFSLEDHELVVEVHARYLYGEKVEGVAYVVFGVELNGQKVRLSSMKQVKNLDGGTVSLSIAEIKSTYPDINSLVGSSIYVKASVMTSTGSDLVETEKSGIKIVLAPYLLAIKSTHKFYKAGLPYDMTVMVSHHDGSPAPNIPVKITFLSAPITAHSGTFSVSLNMPYNLDVRRITAETVVPELTAEKQTKLDWSVQAYQPFNFHQMNFLYISVDKKKQRVGETLNLKLHINTFSHYEKNLLKHVSYTVLSKGKIIRGGRVTVTGQDVINLPLLVTAEMVPAFRVVAYYIFPWKHNMELVSDSILVEMESQCVGSLEVGLFRGEAINSYSPGDSFSFQVRGDPGAKVSLVAVDNSVFLLSKSHLTQKKMWNTLLQGDGGCSSGGGENSLKVFMNAGLSFHSSFLSNMEINESPCSRQTRKRRSDEQMQIRAQLEKTYADEYLQRCCNDGMREIPMPYSCRRRALYITEPWSCVLAFLQCCAHYRGEVLGVVTPPPPTTPEPLTTTTTSPVFDHILRRQYSLSRKQAQIEHPQLTGMSVVMRSPPIHTARIVPLLSKLPNSFVHGDSKTMPLMELDEEDCEDLDDIYIRTKFFESWLWTDVQLPSKAGSDGLAVAPVDTVLPDSITQWGILGISASSKTGFCVAEPFNVRSWKPFFVDLRLPRTAARNEHVEIKVVVHNHLNENLQVLVVLARTEDMCSAAFSEDHKQQVLVGARSSIFLHYIVIPLRAGELPLQVTAYSRHMTGQDAIRKPLRVVVEGVQKMDVRSFVLNPTEQGDAEGNQVFRVKKAKLNSVVPNSSPETFVNVRGNLLADSIDNCISKDSLAALIRMPGGCVEQNLASITLPLIAAHYLDGSKQWEIVGIQRREQAFQYIKRGYENQLYYRKQDNSYPPYRNEGTSTWITAFVVKVFSMALRFISVDEQHICGPLLYLLKNKQLFSGAFKEDNPVYSTSMTGGLQGAESRETLTAFVLIALAEAQSEVTCSQLNVEVDFRRAGSYLKARYHRLSRPYSVAIACYALAMSNQGCMKSVLLKSASPDHTHWPDANNWFFTLEATGYALLALLKGGHIEEATAPFKWLNKQRGVGGGYGNTQSTMVVLQALSEYLMKRPPPSDMNLQVALSVPGRSDMRWAFTPRLAHVARSVRVPLDQDFSVVALGNGQGILEVVTVYNQLPDVHERSSCNGFDLNVSISETNDKPPADVEKVFKLSISVRALAEHQVRMVVLDISLPTGFEPETSDLEQLTNTVDRYINNFQVVDNLSDRGSLIIHLFKVPNKEADLIPFRLYQKFKVGLLQPSTVTVYQYYNKDKQCCRFYTPPEDKEQLSQICKDNICRCTQGDCTVMKLNDKPITVSERKRAACSGTHHVFKVRVMSASTSQYDRYELEILQVIKEGSEVGLKPKERRVFLSHASCRAGLNLIEQWDYLIIGPSSDVWPVGSSNEGYTYTMGKQTWVESWPSSDDCVGVVEEKCSQLNKFATELLNTGCHT
ncbi:complement C3-like [Trichomycterus rosablanca]|uniref:complement C3-like n=1 Tax=Trichomycterus rosablanca TaxID=2290929 RepID=UPI002F3527A8